MLFSTHLNAGNSHLISMHSASVIRILREFLLEANLQTARPQFVRNISFVFWKKRTFLQMSFFSLFCCVSSFVHKSTVEKCVFPPWKREKSLTFDLGKCALSSSLPSFLPSFDWQRFYCSRYLTRFLSLFLFLSSLASTQMYFHARLEKRKCLWHDLIFHHHLPNHNDVYFQSQEHFAIFTHTV